MTPDEPIERAELDATAAVVAPRAATTLQPAPRPPRRTVRVRVPEGDFAGWEATVVVDFPAGYLRELQTGDLDRVLALCERLMTDWNFPDSDGQVAASLADVDPWTGIVAVLNRALSALDSLPKR